jgi:hypothetical protein
LATVYGDFGLARAAAVAQHHLAAAGKTLKAIDGRGVSF